MPDFYVVIKGIPYFREQSFFDFWIINTRLKKSRLNNKIQNLFFIFDEYQRTRVIFDFDWVVFAYFFFLNTYEKFFSFFFRRIMNKFRYNFLRNADQD